MTEMLLCPATSVRSTPRTSASAVRGEHANVQLKNWKVLRKIHCGPHRATSLVKAILVLILTG